MAMVNIHAAKTHLSSLVDQAVSGEDIVIARAGKPMVRLVPVAKPPRVLGQLDGKLMIPDDFDDPLPGEIRALFEGSED